MKIKRRLLLSLGVGAAIVTPIATVIACSDTDSNRVAVDNKIVEKQLNKIKLEFKGFIGDGNGSFAKPDWNLKGTELIYGTSNNSSSIPKTFKTTIPTKLKNKTYVWINAQAKPGYVINGIVKPVAREIKLLKPVKGNSIQIALNNMKKLEFNGTNGLGSFDTPTWNIAGTELLYGMSDNQSIPPTYSNSVPTNLLNNKYLWISVAPLTGYGIDGTFIPRKNKISGLNTTVDVAPINTALADMVLRTRGPNETATFAKPVWEFPTVELIYAVSTSGTDVPKSKDFFTTIPTNLKNNDYVWISGIAKFGNTFSDSIVPSAKFIDKLPTAIPINEVNSALASIQLSFTGLDALTTFTEPSFNILNTFLEYGVSSSNTNAPQYKKEIPTTLHNGDYVWIIAVADPGYLINGTVIPSITSVNNRKMGINVDQVNTALSNISIALDGYNNATTFTVSEWNMPNTTLKFATTDNATPPSQTAYSDTVPGNLSNGKYVWITAFAKAGYEFTGGDIVPFSQLIAGLNTRVSAGEINQSLNSLSLQFTGNNDSGTFSEPNWNYKFSTTLEYSVSAAGLTPPESSTFSATIPTNLSNGKYVWITAIAKSGYMIDGPVPPKAIEIKTLTIVIDVTEVNNQLKTITLSLEGINGSGKFAAPAWSIENTTLQYAVTPNATPPTSYSPKLPEHLKSLEYIWITAKANNGYAFSGAVVPISKKIEIFQLTPKVEKFDTNKNIPPASKATAEQFLKGNNFIASQRIASTDHYLVLKKDDKNIWNITVDTTSGLIKNVVNVGSLENPPNVQSKNVFQKVDDSNYLVATSGDANYSGIGVINVNPTTGDTRSWHLTKLSAFMPSTAKDFVTGASLHRVGITNKYWYTTNNQGLWQMVISVSDGIATITGASQWKVGTKQNEIPNNLEGAWFQKLDNEHFWLSTANNGIFRISLDANSSIGYTDPVPMTGTVSIPSVGGGFVEKIDDTHFYIGTKSNGLYRATIGQYGVVTATRSVPMTGPKSIPDVHNGTIAKIDEYHYLIGTYNDGLYEVTLDSYTLWISKSTRDTTINTSNVTWIQNVGGNKFLVGIAGESLTKDKEIYQISI